jgi:NAD(P)-dependent dehydrogenase (short-subunit alcohol dehydrogenase family)
MIDGGYTAHKHRYQRDDTTMATPSMSRSALVTGGGTGIGRATARRLLHGGFDVTIVGRRADVLDAAASELAVAAGTVGTVRTQVADVSDPAANEVIVADHVAEFGGLDALVTAAAASKPVPFLETTAATWDATLGVALRGTALVAVAAARHMVSNGGGRIVLFSSINGFQSKPDTADYSAAKAAVASLAKSMAVDLAPSGVITNAIAPGWVRTPMTEEFLGQSSPETLKAVNPLGRAGEPAEIADVVWFLVDQAPTFLVGTTIYVDGGQTVAAPMP